VLRDEGQRYTSARLHTKAKGDWLYGRVEARTSHSMECRATECDGM
jgi:beta-glucanase (GH16 family)